MGTRPGKSPRASGIKGAYLSGVWGASGGMDQGTCLSPSRCCSSHPPREGVSDQELITSVPVRVWKFPGETGCEQEPPGGDSSSSCPLCSSSPWGSSLSTFILIASIPITCVRLQCQSFQCLQPPGRCWLSVFTSKRRGARLQVQPHPPTRRPSSCSEILGAPHPPRLEAAEAGDQAWQLAFRGSCLQGHCSDLQRAPRLLASSYAC